VEGALMKKTAVVLVALLVLPGLVTAETTDLQVIPDEVVRGNTITFDIIGQESSFTPASAVSFEPSGYITVQNLYLLEPTRLMAETDIAPDAPAGSYTLTVTTGDQVAQGMVEVIEAPPSTSTTAPSDAFCPATMIYGEDSEEVKMLRQLRDTRLTRAPAGQELTHLYYFLSPVLARAMQEDRGLRGEIKALVDDLLPLIEVVLK